MQIENVEETIIIADTEAEYVGCSNFKQEIADLVPQKKRGIYKTTKDLESRGFFIFGTNTGLKVSHDRDGPIRYDYAFDRRIFLIKFENFVGKNFTDKTEKRGSELLKSFNAKSNIGEMKKFMNETSAILRQEYDEESDKTIFEKNGFDMKNTVTCGLIKRGILYYLFDLIHVFDLSSLNNSTYIQPSKTNARHLAANNYEIMKTILSNYTCYTELVFDYVEIPKNTPQGSIRLDKALKLDTKNSKPLNTSLTSVISTLSSLGMTIDSTMSCNSDNNAFNFFNVDSSIYNDMSNDDTSNTGGSTHVPASNFFLYGLKENTQLTQKELDIKNNPNKSHRIELKDFRLFETSKEFVNAHIRIDHRIIMHGKFGDQMYDVLKNLLLNHRVCAKIKPKLHKKWKDVTTIDLTQPEKLYMFYRD
jgi:hypothetical protein